MQLRFQLISGATDYSSMTDNMAMRPTTSARRARYAFAGFAQASYFFGEGDFRTYVAGTGGLGTIRHVDRVRVAAQLRPDAKPDLHRHRPVGAGVRGRGRGHHVQPEPGVRADVGTNALLGFTKFTFHIDLNAGVAFEYCRPA